MLLLELTLELGDRRDLFSVADYLTFDVLLKLSSIFEFQDRAECPDEAE